MKKINYFGEEYEVSDLVNYVATDKNGSIWGHEVKPKPLCGRFIYKHGYLEFISGYGKIAENWKDSLRQVKDIIVKEDDGDFIGHPHADLMLKYAMIAQYDDKPWESFEFKNQHTDDWMGVVDHPCWGAENEYRLKPQEPKIQIGQVWVSKEGVDVEVNRCANGLVFTRISVGGLVIPWSFRLIQFLENFKLKG